MLAGIVVVVGGALAGYYYIGGSSKSSAPSTPTTITDIKDEPQAPVAPPPRRKVAAAGEYTAPGAPEIEIAETKVSLTPKKPLTPPPTDSEASETGVAPTDTPTTPNTAPDTSGMDSSADNSTNPNGSKASQTSGADSQNPGQTDSGQQALVPPPPPPPPPPANPSDDLSQNAPLYHVEAGVFQNEKNAKILEDTLKHRGYAAMTLKSTDGDHDTFVVQVGAFKSKVTADEVAGELTSNGFPASVAKGQ